MGAGALEGFCGSDRNRGRPGGLQFTSAPEVHHRAHHKGDATQTKEQSGGVTRATVVVEGPSIAPADLQKEYAYDTKDDTQGDHYRTIPSCFLVQFDSPE